MQNSRRSFLKHSALAIAGTTLLSNDLFASYKKKNEIVGIQLYSIRAEMQKDPLATLQALSKMGYKHVEHANYVNRKFYGYAPAEFKKILSDLGIKMESGHSVMSKKHLTADGTDFTDEWKYTVEDSATAGQIYVISPYMDAEIRKDHTKLMKLMEVFNKSGELCNKYNMKFGYHNHDFEFSEKLNGETLFDIILTNTDPKLVVQQLDIGNMVNGGAKAIDILNKYPNRFESMHVKDEILSKEGNEKYESTILGKGIVNSKEVIDLGRKLGGTTHFIIEQEAYQGMEPLDTAKENLKIMKAWGYK
ncbi:MAG: sugar phosphate isomerase/epimerase family protein [Flavitalea sp.]